MQDTWDVEKQAKDNVDK